MEARSDLRLCEAFLIAKLEYRLQRFREPSHTGPQKRHKLRISLMEFAFDWKSGWGLMFSHVPGVKKGRVEHIGRIHKSVLAGPQQSQDHLLNYVFELSAIHSAAEARTDRNPLGGTGFDPSWTVFRFSILVCTLDALSEAYELYPVGVRSF